MTGSIDTLISGQLSAEPVCPFCNHILDGFTIASDDKSTRPTEGDISVCMYCSNILEFYFIDDAKVDVGLREAPEGLSASLMEEVAMIQKVVDKFKK